MPLFAVGSENVITGLPRSRQEFFNTYSAKISAADMKAIKDALNDKFDEQKGFNSSHVPGRKWDDGPYAPILAACNGNETYAGWLFGLLVWEVAMNRKPDIWHFYKPETEADEIRGTTYIPK